MRSGKTSARIKNKTGTGSGQDHVEESQRDKSLSKNSNSPALVGTYGNVFTRTIQHTRVSSFLPFQASRSFPVTASRPITAGNINTPAITDILVEDIFNIHQFIRSSTDIDNLESLAINEYPMAANRMDTFSGAPGEDAKLFVKQVKYAFIGRKHLFDDSPGDFDDARITTLITSTTGEARKWIRNLDDTISSDWVKLTEGLQQRFPQLEWKDNRRQAIKALSVLQQGNRPLTEYCEVGRDILLRLGDQKEWDQEVADRLVDGLADQILKKVVGGTLRKMEYSLEKAIETIQGTSRDEEKRAIPAPKERTSKQRLELEKGALRIAAREVEVDKLEMALAKITAGDTLMERDSMRARNSELERQLKRAADRYDGLNSRYFSVLDRYNVLLRQFASLSHTHNAPHQEEEKHIT